MISETTDLLGLIEETEMVVKGLQVVLKLFPRAKGVICIENNKKDAYDKLTKAVAGIANIETALLKTKYPQGGERQLIVAVTGRKINVKILPADAGCIVDNLDTFVSIGYAVCKSTPLLRRIMTLSGTAYNDNGNFKVPLGISYKELIEKDDKELEAKLAEKEKDFINIEKISIKIIPPESSLTTHFQYCCNTSQAVIRQP